MFSYRTFRNDDPPRVARLWNSHTTGRGDMQPMTAARFEQYVLSKPYFDRNCFFLAEAHQLVVGFAHVGTYPVSNDPEQESRRGSIEMISIEPFAQRSEIAREFLNHCLDYLRSIGCTTAIAGGFWPLDPFYWGLFGGSRSAGWLASDSERLQWFQDSGFRELARYAIWRRQLAGFQPPIDRTQLQLKRSYSVAKETDCVPRDWDSACVLGQVELTCFGLRAIVGSSPVASVTFGDLYNVSGPPGSQRQGLLTCELPAAAFQDGMATYLIGEALRQLKANQTTDVEIVVPQSDTAWPTVCRNLGFQSVDETVVLEKTL